ncbi:HAD family phosphatase [Candidatus Peregrinibacteria bacterium]|nr:HAD family phosphatase [Candidatus Peregrinibacteria bacterium]
MNSQKHDNHLICFDLDGVLINSMEPAIRAFKETMERELGLVYNFTADKKMWAMAPREKINALWGEEIGRRGITAEEIDRAMSIYQKAKMAANIPPFPYAKETVERMAAYFENIAVVSSNANFVVEETLKRIGVLPYVKKIIGTDDVKEAKPDPAMYLKAVGYFKAEPKRSLTFEDSTFGIQAGRNAGIHAIGVATGVETFEELQKTPADIVVRGLSEVSPELVLKVLEGI